MENIGLRGIIKMFLYVTFIFNLLHLIKSQGPGLGHFQIVPKYQKGDISIGMTQATPQIFTLPFTPLTLQ